MKITIEIPEAFEADFKRDRFDESLNRFIGAVEGDGWVGDHDEDVLTMLIAALETAEVHKRGEK